MKDFRKIVSSCKKIIYLGVLIDFGNKYHWNIEHQQKFIKCRLLYHKIWRTFIRASLIFHQFSSKFVFRCVLLEIQSQVYCICFKKAEFDLPPHFT